MFCVPPNKRKFPVGKRRGGEGRGRKGNCGRCLQSEMLVFYALSLVKYTLEIQGGSSEFVCIQNSYKNKIFF